ncbi:MAG: hypothetical protein AB7O88_01920 [Reyranellaceae bacterium]
MAIWSNGRVRNTAVVLVSVFTFLLIAEGMIVAVERLTRRVPVTVKPYPDWPTTVDPALGWKLRASSVVRVIRSRGERKIYDATYTIDARGQRVTPDSNQEGETVLFMGDSFMFGDGLPDSQTLPQHFALQTGRRFNVVNFGVPAYGPHQVLRQIEDGVIDRAIEGKGRVRAAVLYFLDEHLPRAAGDMEEAWFRTAPQYERTPGGVRLLGSAAEVRSHRRRIEEIVSEAVDQSMVASLIRQGIRTYPELKLSEALVMRIRDLVRERYGVDLIVIYWSRDPSGFHEVLTSRMLTGTGVHLLLGPSITRSAGLSSDDAIIADDGHPSGRANAALAAALAKLIAPK